MRKSVALVALLLAAQALGQGQVVRVDGSSRIQLLGSGAANRFTLWSSAYDLTSDEGILWSGTGLTARIRVSGLQALDPIQTSSYVAGNDLTIAATSAVAPGMFAESPLSAIGGTVYIIGGDGAQNFGFLGEDPPGDGGGVVLTGGGAGGLGAKAGPVVVNSRFVLGVGWIQAFDDEAAARLGGLEEGEVYRTGAAGAWQLRVVGQSEIPPSEEGGGSGGGAPTVIAASFTGDGVTDDFTPARTVAAVALVTINGLVTSAYTVAGNTVTFTAPPAFGDAILVTFFADAMPPSLLGATDAFDPDDVLNGSRFSSGIFPLTHTPSLGGVLVVSENGVVQIPTRWALVNNNEIHFVTPPTGWVVVSYLYPFGS